MDEGLKGKLVVLAVFRKHKRGAPYLRGEGEIFEARGLFCDIGTADQSDPRVQAAGNAIVRITERSFYNSKFDDAHAEIYLFIAESNDVEIDGFQVPPDKLRLFKHKDA